MMETFGQWLHGDLGTAARIGTALAPAALFLLWFFGGLVPYALHQRRHGRHHDADLESRGDSVLLGMRLRVYFGWLMRPVWSVLQRSGLPASAITAGSLLFSLAAAVALASGRFALGGWLYILAGIGDFLDGRVARARGEAGPRGAALDSILDRYSDTVVLVGLAWYYRGSWVLVAVLATLVGSMLVSYVRARGEGLGIKIRSGLMQRPERIFVLGSTVALSPALAAVLEPTDPTPIHWLAVAGLTFLAVTTQITAMRRFFDLLHALDTTHPARRSAVLHAGVASLVATAVDFLVVWLLVTRGALPPWLATAVGCAAGAALAWVGTRRDAPTPWRFVLLNIVGALLNAGGVAVVMLLPDVDWRVAWLATRVVVFGAWNLPLHREYLFGDLEPGARDARVAAPGPSR